MPIRSASRSLCKLVTFQSPKFAVGGLLNRVGVLLEDGSGVIDIQSCAKTHGYGDMNRFKDMQSLIEGGDGIVSVIKRLCKTPPVTAIAPISDVKIQAPIPRPQRNVFCLGKNYSDHIAEMKKSLPATSLPDGLNAPEAPIFFTKAPECVISTGDYIESHSKITKQLDYEAEMVVIIGKTGRDISIEKAMDYVFGYTIAHDVSSRDLQKR